MAVVKAVNLSSKRVILMKEKLVESQVTPEKVFWNRRKFISNFALAGASIGYLNSLPLSAKAQDLRGQDLKSELSSEYVVTHHNNFYEFSTSFAGIPNIFLTSFSLCTVHEHRHYFTPTSQCSLSSIVIVCIVGSTPPI